MLEQGWQEPVSGQMEYGYLGPPAEGPSQGWTVTVGAFLTPPQRQEGQGIRS
jgi:hypothetical protein